MQHILPREFSEFQSKQYWSQFYKTLKKSEKKLEFFEWYGDYDLYCSLIDQIFSEKQQSILHIGCGKSLVQERMVDELGFQQIMNVDYSETIIQDMNKRNQHKQLQYMVADIFDIDGQSKHEDADKVFPDNGFQYLLDKGTLDAIYPEDSQQNSTKIANMYDGLLKKIKDNGEVIIISLLQDFILKFIVQYFGIVHNYNLTFYELKLEQKQNQKQKQLVPFLVRIQLQKDGKWKVVDNANNENQYSDPIKLIESVTSIQLHSQYLNRTISSLIQDQYFSLNIYKQQQNDGLKYILHVIDSNDEQVLSNNTCCVFITPYGHEQDYLFAEKEGMKQLLTQTQMSRLIVVWVLEGDKSMDQIKDELNGIVASIIPNKNDQNVPYMTDGEWVGQKSMIKKEQQFIVEEIKMDDDYFIRRVIDSNDMSVHGQAKLKYTDGQQQSDHVGLMQQLQGYSIVVDIDLLELEYHKAMLSGLSLLQCFENLKILNITQSVPSLSTFLFSNLCNTSEENTLSVDVCLSNSTIKSISEEYFRCGKHDEPFHKYQLIEQHEYEQKVYDLVLLENIGFIQLSDKLLKQMQSILSDNGVLILHCQSHKQQTINMIKPHFSVIYSQYLSEQKCIIYAVNVQFAVQNQKVIVDKQVVRTKKEIEQDYKVWMKNMGGFQKVYEAMDVQSYVSEIHLEYPTTKNIFEHSELHFEEKDKVTSASKEAYMLDQKKMNKKRKKQKKNKAR